MGDHPPVGSHQLWILRHAKAADAPPGGRDRDRPLADRGRRDATALGDRLAAGGSPLETPGLARPDLTLCSAAVRTVQTADLVRSRIAEEIPLEAYRSLYDCRPDTVLTYVREVDEHVRSVLVVGHNPTVSDLAWELLAERSRDRDRLESHAFPTCALAVIDLSVDGWEDTGPGRGSLLGLFAPPY